MFGIAKKGTPAEAPVSHTAALEEKLARLTADRDAKGAECVRIEGLIAQTKGIDRAGHGEDLKDARAELAALNADVANARAELQHSSELDDEAAVRAHSHAFDERAGKAGIKAVADLVTAVRSWSEAIALRDYALQLRRAIGVYTVPPQAVESLHFRAMEKFDYGSEVVSYEEIHWPSVSVTLDRVEVPEAIAKRMWERSGLINPDDVAKHAIVNAELAARSGTSTK